MPNRWEMPPLYLQSGDPETENVPSMAYPGQLGCRISVKQPGPPGTPGAEDYRHKRYQYVQTDSTMSVAPFKGAVAWWSSQARYLVTTSCTKLGRGRIAGVFQNAITPGWYGCIQIGGPATVKFVDGPTAAPTEAGLIVIPSATDGKADCLAAASAATYPALGRSAGTYDAAACEGIVDLDVPETV